MTMTILVRPERHSSHLLTRERVAIREELETSGKWLFRWRGYLPLALFLPVIAGFGESPAVSLGHNIDAIWEWFCVIVSLIGVAIRVATVGRAPGGTSGRRTVGGPSASALNTTGMYSVVRHPLYLGNYFQWLGVAMIPRNPWVAITVSLIFWIYYERIMFAEEEYLRRAFGTEFETWASRTPTFLPDFARWVPAALPFCWRSALQREHSGVFALVASFTLVCVLDDALTTGHMPSSSLWFTAFGLAAVSFAALRFLTRRTNLLRVPGR
jgi:protein-S-isoprenylcysteine O-methyltransferase Ste14